jgi:hypothetical protein
MRLKYELSGNSTWPWIITHLFVDDLPIIPVAIVPRKRLSECKIVQTLNWLVSKGHNFQRDWMGGHTPILLFELYKQQEWGREPYLLNYAGQSPLFDA